MPNFSEGKMNCPKCQKLLPSNYSAVYCPFCGGDLPVTGAQPGEPVVPYKLRWPVFFAVLLAPPVLTLLAAMANAEGMAVGTPLVGGAIAGIACGIMLAQRLGRTHSARILLGFLFTAVFGVLSFALSFVGCMTGGFKFNMH